jgi:hypothetical protein
VTFNLIINENLSLINKPPKWSDSNFSKLPDVWTLSYYVGDEVNLNFSAVDEDLPAQNLDYKIEKIDEPPLNAFTMNELDVTKEYFFKFKVL